MSLLIYTLSPYSVGIVIWYYRIYTYLRYVGVFVAFRQSKLIVNPNVNAIVTLFS